MNNLKIFRKRSCYSQNQVAQKLNITQQAYAKWESGKSNPRTDKLPELATIFECSIDDLFSCKGA